MPLHDHQNTTLKALGMNEAGIRDWLVTKPTRLGLGNIAIKAIEIQHSTKSGGRLDILAYDAALDTYYEIDLMLGEMDGTIAPTSLPCSRVMLQCLRSTWKRRQRRWRKALVARPKSVRPGSWLCSTRRRHFHCSERSNLKASPTWVSPLTTANR